VKATELLRLYKAGQRDFRDENLRGQNFKGQNLAGADLSGADIRSTNFTNANLTNANFTRANAGLQRRWTVGLVLLTFFLSGLTGLLSAYPGRLTAVIAEESAVGEGAWMVLSVVLIVLALLSILLLFKGLIAIAISVAIAGTLAGTFAFAISVDYGGFMYGTAFGVVTTAGAGFLVTSVAAATSIAVAGVGTVAGVMAAAIFGAVVGSIAIDKVPMFGIEEFTVQIGFGAGVIAGAMTLPSLCVGWRALKGDKRDTWLRSVAVSFASIGGRSFRGATLINADFSQARLKGADLRRAILLRTCWRGAQKLDRVRPGKSYLSYASVRQLVLTGEGQGQSYANLLNLTGINLQGADLVQADFTGSNLKDSNLQGATLANASFTSANLNGANLRDTDLSNAKLVQAQLDEADLTGAILTGACIEDWGITTRTRLNGIRCDYVFMRLLSDRRSDQNPHRKPDDWAKNFAEGEFVDFITPMVETLDLYHNQAVDPRAVAIAFNELREQNPGAELEIVSMEKRGRNRDKFLLRAEATPAANLSELHSQYFDRYEHLLTLPPEAIYALLIEKDMHAKQLAGLIGTAIAQPKTQIDTYHNQGDTTVTQSNSGSSKYSFHGPVGNVADTNYGVMNAHIEQNRDDISRLMTSLRDLAQSFPTAQIEEVHIHLEDLANDLKQEKPQPSRLRTRLVALFGVAIAVSGAVATATDFANNLLELSAKLSIPAAEFQRQLQQLKELQPDFDWQP
jgi:uncharacterized protein YjbI with pentapeptide repeats